MYVFYRHGGEHFMLTHWTHNEQTHIVLGRTPEACLAVVNSPKFTTRDYPEVRTFEHITIVQPTLEFQYKVQVRNSLRERGAFKDYALQLAREHKTFTGEFPEGFMECPRYMVRNKSDYYTDDKDDEHYGCANCQSKVVVNRATMLALYAAASLRNGGPDNYWRIGVEKNHVRSQAPYADPNRDLYEMVSNPGHHSSGTEGQLAVLEFGMRRDVLFYYHKERTLPEWLARAQKSVADRKAEFNRAKNSKESEFHRRLSERNHKRRIEVMAFFSTKE